MPVATNTFELARPHVRKWWKDAVVYQVWPTSYSDSNGDGIGDLAGIESKVDYLKDLGIDVLWLSPIFKSPLVDMGYDISDYEQIDPRFGTIENVKSLASKLHSRDMKLLLDLVVNHTSDKHAWFEESRSSKTNPKRDWYIWRPARYNDKGERIPPCNWVAAFGGSVWEWDEHTQEYYLHYFCPEQPDLNWENPDVRQAVWNVMKFWLNIGVDGFRMDVINMISKNLDFPDVPVSNPNEFLQATGDLNNHFFNGPRLQEFLKEMYDVVISNYDMMTVGEMPGTYDSKDILRYVHEDSKQLQMAFDFSLVSLSGDEDEYNLPQKWQLSQFKEIIAHWSEGMYDGGWWAIYLENHDQCRSVSRWTSDLPEHRHHSSKMLSMMQLSTFGTPYIYQGQEIGMINLPQDFPLEEYKDVRTINKIKAIRERGGPHVDELIHHVQARARDNGRSPMQWDDSANGGFTTGSPWMMSNPDYKKCNVASQLDDDKSVLAFWRRMIKLRKDNEVLTYGKFALMSSLHESVFAYTRTVHDADTGKHDRVLLILNFSPNAVMYDIPVDEHPELRLPNKLDDARLVIGTYDDVDVESKRITGETVELRPFEGLMFRLDVE